MNTFVPTDRDHDGLQTLLSQARAHDGPVEIKCFSHDEAMWIRRELEARGIPGDRLAMTWLNFGKSRD